MATPEPAAAGATSATAPPAGRWTSRRALVAHGALLVWVPGCVVACWWQVTVALSGDSLGWVYSVMWPLFAVFGTIFWWHFVHDDPDTVGRRGLLRIQAAAGAPENREDGQPDPRAATLARAEAEDPELAEYNAYLAALAREARPSTWRGH